MEVISTSKYDATSSSKTLAPAKPTSTTAPNIVTHYTDMFIQNPENSTAKVIEEEWETRKKKEITTTRQIETRIKRQVVLEDGEVIKDSGPFVTTNTTEDIEQQEQTTQEKRTIANDDNSLSRRRERSKSPSISTNLNGNITLTSDKIISDGGGGSIIQKELNETIVKSREEVEELVETEKRQHLGDISDEAYQLAIIRNNNNSRKNLRMTLAETVNQLSVNSSEHIEPRIIQHTTKSNKIVDTEKKIKRTGIKPDGAIVTETKTSVTHEEINDVPDYSYSDRNDDNDDTPRETKKESSQKFFKQRDEDVVDYLLNGEKIARERRFISEITEGDRIGDPYDDNIRTTLNRKNVLTKKPLSFDEEDEVKKFETSKWLENHFGSDHGMSSHSSKDEIVPSNHNDNNRQVQVQTINNKSFINVTMKSSKSQDSKNNNKSKDTYINTYIDKSYSELDQPVRSSNKQQNERISNWSERKQQHNISDKQNVNGNSPSSLLSLSSSSTTTSSYCRIETPQINGGEKEQLEQQENLPPQQTLSKKIFEDSSYVRTSSSNVAPHYYSDNTDKHKQLQRNTSNSSSSLQQRCHCQNSNKNHQQISVTNRCKCVTDDSNLSSPSPQLPPHSSSAHVIKRTRDNRNKKIYHYPPQQQQQQKQYHYHGQFDNLQPSELSNNSPQQKFCCHRRRNRDRRCRSSSPPSLIKFSSAPTIIKREKKSSNSDNFKNSTPNISTTRSTKSKIGESFRRFVNKLRSASTERRNKKSSVNGGDSGGNSGISNFSNTTSVSQVTQTDDNKNQMTTYLQYNSIDKNIPDTQYHYNQTGDDVHDAIINNGDNKLSQEKQTKNGSTVISSPGSGITKTIKVTRLNGHIANYDQYGRNNSITPVHRYYIKESFRGRQNTDRDTGYKNKSATRSRKLHAVNDDNNNNKNNNINNDDEINNFKNNNNNNNVKYNQTLSRPNNEPSTFLGRFSKSASRLMTSTPTTNEYDQKDRQVTSTQTLPRKLQRYLLVRNNNNNNINNNNNNNNNSLTKKKPLKPPGNQFSSSHNHLNFIKSSSSSSPSPTQSFAPLSSMSPSSNKSMHYGSMINISIKHNAPPQTIRENNTAMKMTVGNNTGTLPVKPDRSYKSSLSRSKSFNVLEDNTTDGYSNKNFIARNYSPSKTYKSNTQLHRLDETPSPLKSPSILASINRYSGAGDNKNSNFNL
ncbi:probable cyclin-dependent serine/threonine-protein kinase DDB_G0292550 isoform X1 [Microplitis mediator]|uniref:probable cyclin-dependent serine/threonine-protein kinase DDB_G0292550 isoform X1 n=1 Tax=Microplitis mediator TaxID=375433 RepID=UPI002557992C|nr:probable cyclin-dependent serine/threonine-protein kinase DDB_G0292550 isoform X1 [Microplitis mediator]XP_057326652.1 probable cyclin-dependent serine/threonine-protein kinase DDB_G0292550 isoform X1 [Microplitis mediator]